MASTTPVFGLRKPTNTDTVNVVTDIAGNMDLIDAHAHSGTYVVAANVRDQQFGLLPAPVVAGRVFRPSGFQNLTDVTFQRIYRMYSDASQVRLVFMNWAPQGTPQENSVGPFTLKANVIWRYEQANPVQVPVFFSGVRTITLNRWQVIVSDPIDVHFDVTAGSYFVVRSYVTTSGAFVPTSGESFNQNSWNEGYLTGDYSDSNGNSFGGATLNSYSFGPVAVCGWPTNGKHRSVAIVGDSISAGSGWQLWEGSYGFANWALDQAQVGAVNLSRGGEAIVDVTNYANTLYRLNLSHGCRYALGNYGTNDVGAGTTLANIKSYLLSYWDYLVRRGMTVYWSTIVPRTSTTDGFQTVANQSVLSAAPETVRQSLNQWLRAPAAAGAGSSALVDAGGDLAGVFDTTLQVEVNSDGSAITVNVSTGAISNGTGGRWKIDATTYDSGTVTSIPSSQKLADSTKSWTTNQYRGYYMIIVTDSVTPAAVGQYRLISANTATELSTDTAWTTTPSTSATYRIYKSYVTDGIHPTSFGHKAMADGVNTALLVAS